MSWQDEIKNGVRTASELASVLGLPPEKEREIGEITERYPMLITPYYLSLADKSDPNDPIARMCVPSADELSPGGRFDTSGEAENTKVEGLQHKYRETALILSTNQCAMYCRHCFRKRLVGLSTEELNRRADEAAEYIRAHAEIKNVLISGGDALMNPNAVIGRYLKELSGIEHLDFIRFGTRVPVTLPERIYGDGELLELFEAYSKRKTLCVVTQFNHPREITPQSERAVRCLLERGIQVRNQTVLLSGVNDNADTLSELLSGLTRIGVSPYYIFQCRPVTGVKGRFQVPFKEGIRLVDEAKCRQNGFGKSVRYVLSHPLGKIEIFGTLPNGETVFKFHQSKYPENAARIFTRTLPDGCCWLDDDLEPM